MPYSIAIDGPAGAGKSTIARAVARELGYVYVDTGAMYRALALYCLRAGMPLLDEKAVTDGIEAAAVEIAYDAAGVQQVYLNGENVSESIRTQEVGDAASTISRYLRVREKLVALQQELARESSVVMDGRDIGTKVLPDANLKIYLTAAPEIRAERRLKELLQKGIHAEAAAVLSEVKERDYRDMNRENSPLIRAEDAVLLDSSDMTIDETIDSILGLADGGN